MANNSDVAPIEFDRGQWKNSDESNRSGHGYQLFHTPDGVAFAEIVLEGARTNLEVKGDAFRIILRCDTTTFKKVKKIEARLLNPPKPEKGKD